MRKLFFILIMLFSALPVVRAVDGITDLKVIGRYYESDARALVKSYTEKGWKCVDQDLNEGAGTNSYWIFLIYKTSSDANPINGYVTDIVTSNQKKDSFTKNGRTYYLVSIEGSGFNGDLNQGAGSSSADIYLYYTKDRVYASNDGFGGSKRVITKLWTNSESSSGAIYWYEGYDGPCDFNKKASGPHIYMMQTFATQKMTLNSDPTFKTDLTYQQKDLDLIQTAPSVTYGRMTYSVDGGDWTTSAKAKSVGDHTVKYRLDGYDASSGIQFADPSDEKSKTVTIGPPYGKPTNLNADFDMENNQVKLTWGADKVYDYKDYKWVIYRGNTNTKIETLTSSEDRIFYDTGYNPNGETTYYVYYVSNLWNESRKEENCGAEKTVTTTRSIPIRDFTADTQNKEQIEFSWTSDKYKLSFGHKFYIYVDNESTPIDTIIPTIDEQIDYKWIHRNTTMDNPHDDRVNGVTADGTDFTEEPLNACGPHDYTVVAVIDNTPLSNSKSTLKSIAIGNGTQFYYLKASKGAYAGMVKLSWRVKSTNSTNKTYIIQRRRADSDEDWTTIHTMSSTDEYVFYTDDTPLPGVYYEYLLTVQDKCSDNGTPIQNQTTDIGFAQTTGTVSGRITYGSSGMAVEGVDVVAERTGDTSEDTEQYHALRLTSGGSNVSWEYPTATYAQEKFSTGDFSIQLWMKPEEYKDIWFARLFSGSPSVALSMFKKDQTDNTKQGQLLFCDGVENHTFDLHLKKDEYSHVTLTRKGDQLICYLMQPDSAGVYHMSKDTVVVEGGMNLNLSAATHFRLGDFKGYIDEFRLWTKCLSETEILNNYDRLLVGNEKNLETYWTFDEGLKRQFFDYSRNGSVYNEHHGKVENNAEPSTNTPKNLALKAKTDSNGNYLINGIPFSGEGTTYAIKPELGIHEFNPTQHLRYVSNNSLVHNGTDFEDISSFPVSGYIFYAGTEYPVEGVSFYVDGTKCVKNGQIITSDADGAYEISVPIGKHFIQIEKNGHVFEANGRYPADPAGTGEATERFNSEVQNLTFTDNTLVNFTGRIVGGNIEGEKTIGFGLSENNIGVTEMILQPTRSKRMNVLPGNTALSFLNNKDSVLIASATDKINSYSIRKGGEGKDCQKIIIRTDRATGEFSAMLPPVEYEIISMQVMNNSTIDFGALQQVNLTNASITWSDTLYNDDRTDYELYEYNTCMKKVYHSRPTFTVAQKGRTDGSFGIDRISLTDEQGKLDINDIYTGSGKDLRYNYGVEGHKAPLFIMEDPYTFEIKGSEDYVNADNGQSYHVPLAGTVVTINNALSSDQNVYVEDGNDEGEEVHAGQVKDLKSNQLELDSLGCATYTWHAGLPNIVEPYTRTISMTYEIDGRNEQWDGNGMEGIILGDLPTGNNFVTAGPDRLLMILRDPPGTGSSAEWSWGSSTTTSKLRGNTFTENAGVKFEHKFGFKAMTIAGTPGVGTITEAEAKDDLTLGAKMESSGENSTTKTTTTTVTKTITTSDAPEYVGADGDVYIGTSTNIIFGNARDLGLHRTADGGAELGVKNIISTGLSYNTMFSYSQYYIENTLFPNFELIRRNLLKTVDQATIDSYENTTDHVVYYTTLSEDDEDFGQPDTYTAFPPKKPKPNVHYEDSVKWVTNQIKNWTKYLALNDSAKVEAFKARSTYLLDGNVSFDAGTTVSSSTEVEKSTTHTWDWTVSAGLVVENSFGFEINKFGVDCTIEDETTGGRHETDETEEAETTSFSYTLAEEGEDAISVDILQFDAYGPIFHTRGGQTSNPYEGQVVTKYYEPGTTIMEATMQIEVPQIDVDVPIVSDVPTGSAASYTLRLGNASEIGADVAYKIFVLDETNPYGAQLSIDGNVLTEGRMIKVPGNQTVSKTLQLRQTDLSVLDYEGNNVDGHELFEKGIGIVFASESQPEEIADTVFIKAYFVPSSSPVTLALSNKLMNTDTSTDLNLTFSGFDRNYRGLKAFRLQYKKQGATDWTQFYEYVTDPDAVNVPTNELLPAIGASVNYTLPMASFADGDYVFRVVSVATYGTGEVTRYSDEITLVKDMQRPVPLGTPEPADGILSPGEDISITFNEDIIKGLLTKTANFTITGVLNGAEVAHETALRASGGDEAAAQTEADILLADRDFSIDAWVNLSGEGTIISHGNASSKMTVGVNADGFLTVDIAGTTYTSTATVPTGDWVFLSLSYQNTDDGGELNAAVATDAQDIEMFNHKPVVKYEGNGPIAVGKNMNGAIHELLLWDEAHNMTTALMNRSKTKSPATRHLIGYWKMDEGEGKEIRDYARDRHMTMADETWYLNNENKAVELDGQHYISVNTSSLELYETDDFAIEFWMRGGQQDAEAQLLQMGDISLWTNTAGELQFIPKGASQPDADASALATTSGNILDNAWHHIAINVLRQGTAAVYVDGERKLATNAANVGLLYTDQMILGMKRTAVMDQTGMYKFERPFKGEIDELRVWGATMNSVVLSKQRKLRLTGEEDGLLAYFPFEKENLNGYGQLETIGFDEDLTGSGVTAVLAANGSTTGKLTHTDEAPALRDKPVETSVSFSFTASDNKIVINIDEDPAIVEGCTLNFTVQDVSDLNGNYSLPVLWSAYINCNELAWKESTMDVTQAVNTSSSFTATIVNKGGKQQVWTLSGMPAWLTADTQNGTTSPLDETSITFTVAESTPIGNYEETVYLTGDNGIETPLTVRVKVTGDVPDWAVNPADYEESMNIIGTLEILGATSEDMDDIVSAFIDDECRGVAKLEYKPRYDSYFLTLDIYGNNDEVGKNIEFKAYDASTGVIYPLIKVTTPDGAEAIAFEPNTLVGRFPDPVKFAAADDIEQTIDLKSGWNWMSLAVKPAEFTPETVFAKANGKVSFVKSKKFSASYDADDGWFGRLSTMNNAEMYAVKSDEALTLNVSGQLVKPADAAITVTEGWNWVAFNSMATMSPGDALADLQPVDGDIIKGQKGVAYFDEFEWIGSLRALTPGQGYKIKSAVASERTFTYPKGSTTSGPRTAPLRYTEPSERPLFQAIDYSLYPSNMVLIAKVVDGELPASHVELGIFAGNECREAVFTDDDGMVYITVPGDDNEVTLNFYIVRDGQIYLASENVTYQPDAVYGAPRQPLYINIDNATAVDGIMAAQDGETIYDIAGRKLNSEWSKTQLRRGVYIVNGKKQVKK